MDLPGGDRWIRVAWALVGAFILAIVVYTLLPFVGALFVGLFVYYATRPAYRWLHDKLGHSRISATLTLLLVGLPLLLVMAYAAVLGLRELTQFLEATNLEQARSTLEPYIGSLPDLDREGLVELLGGNLSRIQAVVGTVGAWLLRIFVILTVAYYLLRYDGRISAWFRRSFEGYPTALAYADAVDEDLQVLYTGNLLTIGATGAIAVVVFLGLNAVAPPGTGVGFPILLGLLVGIGTLVPAVGMKLIYFPYTAYLLWQTQAGGAPLWFPIVFFGVTLVVVDLLPDTVVRSFVSSGKIDMGLVLLAYVFGVSVFGWYGVFFAPVGLVLFVRFARDVFPELLPGESQ